MSGKLKKIKLNIKRLNLISRLNEELPNSKFDPCDECGRRAMPKLVHPRKCRRVFVEDVRFETERNDVQSLAKAAMTARPKLDGQSRKK